MSKPAVKEKAEGAQGEGAYQVIAIDKIVPSATNPRKTIDNAHIMSLADSIAQVGVLQPIIVRAAKKVNTFEIVAGECRWRACVKLNKKEVPAIVMDYDDQAALDAQIIENLHRKDVHPMEESDGYAALIKSGMYGKGEAAVTEIAKRVGQTPEYVGRRLRYQKLSKKAQEAFASNKLLIGHVDILCRLEPNYQDQCVDDAIDTGKRNSMHDYGMTVAQLKAHVARNFEHILSGAPFDTTDEKLLPSAPSCPGCHKRTGATASLFGESPKDDRCLDSKCFWAKCQAAIKNKTKELKEQGFEVVYLSGKSYVSDAFLGQKPLDNYQWSKQKKPTGTKGIVVEEGYSGHGVRFGHVLDVTINKTREHGYGYGASSKPRKKGQAEYEQKLKAVKIARSKTFRESLAKAIAAKLPKKAGLEAMRLAIVSNYALDWKASHLCKFLGIKGSGKNTAKEWAEILAKAAPKLSEAQCIKALVYFPMKEELHRSYDTASNNAPISKLVCGPLGVDHAAISKEANTKHPLPEKPPADETKAKAKKGKTAKKAGTKK